MRTAYIYAADGSYTQYRYRLHAINALLRHIPSANIFTLTAGKSGIHDNPIKVETILHIDELFSAIYGAGSADTRVGGAGGFTFPAITFSRILPPLIDELDGFQRFVYMDNDTEVISDSFCEIERIDTRDACISGAQEVYRDKVPGYVQSILKLSGVEVKPASYRNTGVLVINRPTSADDWISMCRESFDLDHKHHFLLGDQDAINAVFPLGEISDAFNYLCSAPSDAPAGTKLCHFAGPYKDRYLKKVALR